MQDENQYNNCQGMYVQNQKEVPPIIPKDLTDDHKTYTVREKKQTL